MLSSTKGSGKETAEKRFRDAFDRLKRNAPKILPMGTPVSQNNVAKEAQCDPTALRKSRYPTLVEEIQQYVKAHEEEQLPSARQRMLKKRERNRTAREVIADLRRQRDEAVGLLADATLRIVELTEELASAKVEQKETRPSAPVISLTRRDPGLRVCEGTSEDHGRKGWSRDTGNEREGIGNKHRGGAVGTKATNVEDRGLSAAMSHLKLKVDSGDILSALAHLLTSLARTRASISTITARALPMAKTEVFLEVETQDGHIQDVVKYLSPQVCKVEVMD
ncbi:hypothetical protein LPW11_09915 [Geomonas sp. RF6]|uniref:hypothetical protein n=1 Tax=Geomonas sp. RF6 TaxID=2897342 RepID=UPI001E324B7A|nr:hypothetical protein [Geomonas sp. RF6]UFS72490.1 hypothetical protein LPW11_09915 [Geomonas sp. RF6]